jgi:hypothetical protein
VHQGVTTSLSPACQKCGTFTGEKLIKIERLRWPAGDPLFEGGDQHRVLRCPFLHQPHAVLHDSVH